MKNKKYNQIREDEHVFIAGMTGSGKTHLAKKYLANYPHVVALDTKGTLEWNDVEDKDLTIIEHLSELSFVNTPKIIYKPVFEELSMDYYEKFFEWCYRRGNCIVWVDEAMNVCPNPHVMPEYYRGILTRGRELGVSVWSLTQRPTGIPQVIMSESSHYFIFKLNLPQDREKIVQISGCPEFRGKVQGHNFRYWHQSWDYPVEARLVERR